MKELKLNNGRSGRLKNKNNISILISKNIDGYYILSNPIRSGPFKKIFVNRINNEVTLIGYNTAQSCFYTISGKELILSKQIQISLTNLLKNNHETPKFNDSQVLGCVNNYYILFTPKDGSYFAYNSSLKENSEKIITFNRYEDLVKYYNEKAIDLYDKKIENTSFKLEKTFINFSKLIDLAQNLSTNDLPEDILYDFCASRNVTKQIFEVLKEDVVEITSSESRQNELKELGYIDIQSTNIVTLTKYYSTQMNLYINLVLSRYQALQNESINFLRYNNEIDFDKLHECASHISINDLPSKIQSEISAKRPLTRQIYSALLTVSIDSLNANNCFINNQCKQINIFKTLYPDQYDKLGDLFAKMLPSLYQEYFKERLKR